MQGEDLSHPGSAVERIWVLAALVGLSASRNHKGGIARNVASVFVCAQVRGSTSARGGVSCVQHQTQEHCAKNTVAKQRSGVRQHKLTGHIDNTKLGHAVQLERLDPTDVFDVAGFVAKGLTGAT